MLCYQTRGISLCTKGLSVFSRHCHLWQAAVWTSCHWTMDTKISTTINNLHGILRRGCFLSCPFLPWRSAKVVQPRFPEPRKLFQPQVNCHCCLFRGQAPTDLTCSNLSHKMRQEEQTHHAELDITTSFSGTGGLVDGNGNWRWPTH